MTAAMPAACLTHRGRPKRRYHPGRALLRAARITRRETGAEARVYRCACGWWHVTSSGRWA